MFEGAGKRIKKGHVLFEAWPFILRIVFIHIGGVCMCVSTRTRVMTRIESHINDIFQVTDDIGILGINYHNLCRILSVMIPFL